MAAVTLYEALESWKNKEQNLARLFSEQSLQSRHFLASKLKHFRELNDRYGRQNEMKGDIGLKLLREEIKSIERELYPNLAERLLRRFMATIKLYFSPERLLENEIARRNRTKENNAIDRVLKDTANKEKLTSDKSEKNQQSFSTTNIIAMIEKNYDYLNNQIKYAGFGEDLQEQLKEKMLKNEPQFTLTFQKDFGKDQTAVTLHFRKSEQSDMYFFNRYSLMLKNDQHPDAIKQTFYINPKEDNITFKEAYNLMSGRFVHKELRNKEGEKYNAWRYLDFKETDKHGNFLMKQLHDKYGYNLVQSIEKHPIKELFSETDKARLIQSLERGNRQSVTLEVDGKQMKAIIEAAPRYKSLNLYDESGVPIRDYKSYKNISQEQTEKQEKKESFKQGSASDDGEPDMGPKKTKRKRQNIT